MVSALDRILGHIEDLDKDNLQILVDRLARERGLLEMVVNTIREGILVINDFGVVQYANTAAEVLVGLRKDDIGGAVLWKQIPDLARTLEIPRDGRYRSSSTVTQRLELRYPERRVIRLYLAPITRRYGDEAEIIEEGRYAVILNDITEEHESTQQEIENERIQSIVMLAAGVAHELGNPLNSLTIHLQLIRRKLNKLPPSPERDKIERSVDICFGEVNRLDGIITHFLRAIRPVAPDFRDLDLLEVLEEALEVVGPEMADAAIAVDVEYSQSPPIVSADKDQLKQVYFNILKNAREAMDAGGTIRIRARADDEFVYIEIGDTGQGIDAESISKVFQPYYTTKDSGSGLGMMIVQRILHNHGAEAHIESRKGVGTLVTLQFPQKHRRIRTLEDNP